jgi:hypothetical protein
VDIRNATLHAMVIAALAHTALQVGEDPALTASDEELAGAMPPPLFTSRFKGVALLNRALQQAAAPKGRARKAKAKAKAEPTPKPKPKSRPQRPKSEAARPQEGQAESSRAKHPRIGPAPPSSEPAAAAAEEPPGPLAGERVPEAAAAATGRQAAPGPQEPQAVVAEGGGAGHCLRERVADDRPLPCFGHGHRSPAQGVRRSKRRKVS